MKVCWNTDVKCSNVERFNGSLKSKQYKWFTRNNTYSYVDVFNKFVSGYDDAMHLSTGMTRR